MELWKNLSGFTRCKAAPSIHHLARLILKLSSVFKDLCTHPISITSTLKAWCHILSCCCQVFEIEITVVPERNCMPELAHEPSRLFHRFWQPRQVLPEAPHRQTWTNSWTKYLFQIFIPHNQIKLLLRSADAEKRQALCKSPWIIWVFQNKYVSRLVSIISGDSSDVQSKSMKLWPRRKVSCGVGTHTTTCENCRSITSQLLATTWLRWLRCWSFLRFQLCVVC